MSATTYKPIATMISCREDDQDAMVMLSEYRQLERENARLQMELDASCNPEELRQVRDENAALRAEKERLDVLSEETRDMYCFLRHSDYAAGIRIYAYFTNVSGRNFPNHMTLREAMDAIIADRHAARKEKP